MTHTDFSCPLPAAFRLSAAAAFYGGFVPMAGAAAFDRGDLRLAFLLDRTFVPVAVTLTQDPAGLTGRVSGTTDAEAVARQVRRMFGLDADPEAWRAVGARDPKVAELQQTFDGFFTAGFPSPYEAAVGGVVVQRTSIRHAATVRRRLSESHGTSVDGSWVLPSPERLLEVTACPGLPDHKIGWLHGIAEAALAGKLDAERLRTMPVDDALDELQQLPGIGRWTAAHALFRGATVQDAVPTAEPRVLRAIALLYGLSAEPTSAELARLTAAWRPFRMWVSILAVRNLVRVAGWSADG